MRIEKKTFDDVVILTFIGELAEDNRQGIFDKIDTILESGYTRLVFNLRLLTFINSTSLGSLKKARDDAERLGGNVVLVQPSRFARKVLVTLGLVELFEVFEQEIDAIRYFHTGVADGAIDLTSLPVEADDKLYGSGALLFRVLGDQPEGPPRKGAIHSVGHITSLKKEGPVFRWTIPASAEEASGSGITAGNFDQRIHEGTELAIKFREPLAMKKRYIRGEARVVGVVRETGEDGVEEATVKLEYTSLDPETRQLLDRHVDGLDELRG
jgi:anti-anti-sigma factor